MKVAKLATRSLDNADPVAASIVPKSPSRNQSPNINPAMSVRECAMGVRENLRIPPSLSPSQQFAQEKKNRRGGENNIHRSI